MSPLIISVIVVAVIAALVMLLVVFGKISASKKKISPSLLKRAAKAKSADSAKSSQGAKPLKNSAEKAENLKKTENSGSQAAGDKQKPQEEVEFSFDEPQTSKKATITNFEDFDEEDKRAFGIGVADAQVDAQPKEESRRKSFEEIMRNRQMAMQEAQEETAQTFDQMPDDDFENFRNEHSVFTRYAKDSDLINQIKNASPQMKAIIFSNLFGPVSRDDK